MKRIFTIFLGTFILASIAMLSGCGGNSEDKAFEKFIDENDALVQSMLEPSEDWLDEQDGGESIALSELEKVDNLLAGLEKLNQNEMSEKVGEAYANTYDAFVAARVALEDILEKTRKSKPMPGGYTEDRELEPEDMEIFEAVMADAEDAEYEPTLVATQVVAGVNYRFTATATSDDVQPNLVYVYIYQPLDGTPELTEIVNVD
ncbi:MAG: hypothetical protein LBU32_27245 [Clostridiales bacterium]|nr:hypothetical protein [Clostridiales bacterium]